MLTFATRGLVFDIQRFALHDGPGIRTTVFLKGCPLHCLWCHNPESQSFQPQIAFKADRCQHCMACVGVCPSGAQHEEQGQHGMDHALCQRCQRCLAACDYGALRLIGEETSVDEILAEVLKDRAYYERSGGGLTLSGGEPVSQFAFVRDLLTAAKAEAVHTCLDTTGFARWDHLAALLPLVDLFLYDYKATDPDEHQRLTGVSNALILENLDRLYEQGARILLRCPLIPGINDSPHHLHGIAALSRRYPDLAGVEIMPYHNLGRHKAAEVGMVSTLADLRSADEATQTAWIDALHALGCASARIG
jgi:pyruvate formate lyase activating enzyme